MNGGLRDLIQAAFTGGGALGIVGQPCSRKRATCVPVPLVGSATRFSCLLSCEIPARPITRAYSSVGGAGAGECLHPCISGQRQVRDFWSNSGSCGCGWLSFGRITYLLHAHPLSCDCATSQSHTSYSVCQERSQVRVSLQQQSLISHDDTAG